MENTPEIELVRDDTLKRRTQRYVKGQLSQPERSVVQEFPLRLTVNGRELTTLVASPHQLHFLVAGFLRNQGFVETLDDFLTLGICEDFGAANIHLKSEIPEKLVPTLTSGCGTGITFNLAGTELRPKQQQGVFYPSEAVLSLMQDLNRVTEMYRSHRGIHSAAVGDDSGLLIMPKILAATIRSTALPVRPYSEMSTSPARCWPLRAVFQPRWLPRRFVSASF